jgi:superfamily I DNA/RNA helicase
MGWFDLMRYACLIIGNSPTALLEQSQKQEFILVDEYQDLNFADQKLLYFLNNGRGSLFAVADVNQSIYSGRFAYPDGINNFDKLYPNSKKMNLLVCSRCPTRILKAAFNLISKNSNPNRPECLIAMPEGDARAKGGFICSVGSKGHAKEAELVGKALRILQDAGVPSKEVLVLAGNRGAGIYMFNKILELDKDLNIQDCLNKPIITIDLGKFLKRFHNDTSDNLSLRILLESLAEIKPNKLAVLRRRALSNQISLWETINLAVARDDVKRSAKKLEAFVKVATESKEMEFRDAMKHYTTVYPSIEGLVEAMMVDEPKKGESEHEVPDDDSDLINKPVTGYRFMTLHSSKGLDADYVFIPFMEAETSFPGDMRSKGVCSTLE